MTSRFRRAIAAASVTLALAGGLAGCTAETDDAAQQSQDYRAQVAAIAEYSAAGEYANALARLDELEAEVVADAADGTLTGDREAAIVEALALVRSDLDAAIAAATVPAPAPEEGDDADDADEDSSGPGNSGDNANTGKGEDKGKGKGKD
ncbi:hypothetical protein BCL57_001215 [Agromyces flavus]|uniref:Mucin-associated surface protein n=1 Tax=Agromyces flavus TaxID=589382 RepID=A0A1H1ZF87_9MICO|nr:hypothetical protein [Agromyces flavus]MCP2367061.1 hypothetical protein [Agromyces flavus]GGI46478.1 hypothetical protein GCM10010932_14820 [Agromyces flavus]SDT32237.1 hypothetical protein SAMN04489721_3140 [Agromyces flavus]